MLIVPQIPFRRRRRSKTAPPSPVGPLRLVACAYQSGTYVDLTFDRPIDIAAIDGEAITADDGDAAIRFRGELDNMLVEPNVVRIALAGFDSWLEPGVTMTATAANGIVAVGGGAAWAG